GLVFGVLDVPKKEIIWLEMTFQGSVVLNLDLKNVEALLEKLKNKLNIGHLLLIKAEAQNLNIVESAELADEVYDFKWASNSAAVNDSKVVDPREDMWTNPQFSLVVNSKVWNNPHVEREILVARAKDCEEIHKHARICSFSQPIAAFSHDFRPS
ncbi:MAG TPA: hypothetical protein PK988_02415, partial [Candidatus Sumerlaeota bacterium]|nr:hypothetical protein [Candidatus Sumerlaeota bacterium]